MTPGLIAVSVVSAKAVETLKDAMAQQTNAAFMLHPVSDVIHARLISFARLWKRAPWVPSYIVENSFPLDESSVYCRELGIQPNLFRASRRTSNEYLEVNRRHAEAAEN
jgi:hypothetical protein